MVAALKAMRRHLSRRAFSHMNRLQGKLAVITGGTSGIGLAAAEAFMREGARVVVTGRDQGNVD